MDEDIMEELKAIESIAQNPEFAWEDYDNVLAYNDNDIITGDEDIFYDGQQAYVVNKSPAGTTYGLRIVSSTTAGSVKLFGYKGLQSDAKPSGTTITAHSGFGAYEQFIDYTSMNPLQLVSMRIQTTEAQINQMVITHTKESVFGLISTNVLPVSSFRTEKDYLTGTITIPTNFLIAEDTHLSFNILASTTLDLILFIGTRKDVSKSVLFKPQSPALMGKVGRIPIRRPVVKKSYKPNM